MIAWKKDENGLGDLIDIAFVADFRVGSVVKAREEESDEKFQAYFFMQVEKQPIHLAQTAEECMIAVENRFNEWLEKAGLTSVK